MDTETRPAKPPDQAAYTASLDWLTDALAVEPARGLTLAEVRERQAQFGANTIGAVRRVSYLAILLNQFRGAVIWLLVAAAALSFWLGDIAETIAIVAVLVVNTLIGFVTETRASVSMEALRKLTHTSARVRRQGQEIRIDAEEIVPGDIVLLEAGDVVPADLRLIETADLNADESTLTGESVPVAKTTRSIAGSVPMADRHNMAFRGSSITRGSALAVATATGMGTQLGEISRLVASATGESTPLERRLDQLGRVLAIAALAVSALIAAIGIIAGKPLYEMLETAIALAVAAVPEGLPIVATLALARGMWRMAARNVLINRLSAVETLGATNVLLTDKTGTLTENRMAVDRLLMADRSVDLSREPGEQTDPQVDAVARVMLLCNDAVLGEAGRADEGDPMEVALLRSAYQLVDAEAIYATYPRTRTVAFDADAKMMATVHAGPDGTVVLVKGAPEAVLGVSTRVMTKGGTVPLTAAIRRDIEDRIAEAGSTGLRMLGLAQRHNQDDLANVYAELHLIGMVGLRDPARSDVPAAIADCHRAGVRVIMVTGDHKVTARKIAQDVGLVADGDVRVLDGTDLAEAGANDARASDLLATDVFARVSPHDKLTLAALHQNDGSIVAMTGDGVNDAPALRKADIGIAMGQRGTQVAAEASDVILRDDAFRSIVEAMRQGRIIYGNIRAFLRYLFTCNLSEILLIAIATFAGMPMPLAPLQILFLNLITDIFPAIALGVGDGPGNVMKKPPRRPGEPLITRRVWAAILGEGCLLSLGAFAVFAAELGRSGAEQAASAAFLTICLAQLLFVFTIHGRKEVIFASQITRNRYVWIAVIFSLVIMLAGVFMPPLAAVLRLQPPDQTGWALILAGSLGPVALMTAGRWLVALPGR